MVDAMGAADLIVAIIELARRDAVCPKMCRKAEAEQCRRDAQEFMATLEAWRAEAEQWVIEHHPTDSIQRHPRRGTLCWEMYELTPGARRNRERRAREKEARQ